MSHLGVPDGPRCSPSEDQGAPCGPRGPGRAPPPGGWQRGRARVAARRRGRGRRGDRPLLGEAPETALEPRGGGRGGDSVPSPRARDSRPRALALSHRGALRRSPKESTLLEVSSSSSVVLRQDPQIPPPTPTPHSLGKPRRGDLPQTARGGFLCTRGRFPRTTHLAPPNLGNLPELSPGPHKAVLSPSPAGACELGPETRWQEGTGAFQGRGLFAAAAEVRWAPGVGQRKAPGPGRGGEESLGCGTGPEAPGPGVLPHRPSAAPRPSLLPEIWRAGHAEGTVDGEGPPGVSPGPHKADTFGSQGGRTKLYCMSG